MSSISIRAERCQEPRQYYFSRLKEALDDAWSEENPDGFIMAAVAENVVSSPLLLERLESNARASTIPTEVLKYNDSLGWPELRTLLCALLSRTIMEGLAPSAENLVLSSGLSSVLDNLFHLLADHGSACLVPAPYYPMFDQDLGLRAGVHTVPVHLNGPAGLTTSSALSSEADRAMLDAAKRASDVARRPVRALLVTRPDNPTGVIMGEERLKGLLRWCHERRLHCIVDEVYGLSVFPSTGPMRSAMVLALEVAEQLPHDEQERFWEHVHVVWALSKDFCGSGLRVGALYTHNTKLLQVYSSVAHMSMISGLTQWQLVQLFRDTAFVDHFIATNCANLEASCQIVMEGLSAMGVPHTQPEAGFFVWMHLGKLLGIDTWQREQEIWEAMFESAKVFVVPGQPCHAGEPGSFRICFASHPLEALHDMLARLQHFLDQYKVAKTKQSWNTQGYMLAVGFGSRGSRS